MKIAVVKEQKKHEYRVGMTPACVHAYCNHGHTVYIEAGAGEGAGFSDEDYCKGGGVVFTEKNRTIEMVDMIVKVKEPTAEECEIFRESQILFTYLHLAPNRTLTQTLLEKRIIGVAYETIQMDDGTLPCLLPMSEIAGRQAVQEGAKYLEKSFGGRGILLGGIPGVKRGIVTILGGGVVGLNAAKIAVGMGAEVNVLDVDYRRLTYLDDIFGSSVQTLYSNLHNVEEVLRACDVLIGAVLIPGAAAPKLVSRDHLSIMKPGAVIVDVSVDQGGCVATSRPTTHDDPIYKIDDIVHYCVANMPGAVALTSTLGLTNQTLLYGLQIADLGIDQALKSIPAIAKGVNLYKGRVTCEGVATSIGLEYTNILKVTPSQCECGD